MDDARSDRNVDCPVRDVSADAIEHSAQLRDLPGHARELPIRGVDEAVKNEKRESEQAEMQSAAGDADQCAQDGEMSWRHSECASAASDDRAERSEKINVRQLLDFEGFESENLRKN